MKHRLFPVNRRKLLEAAALALPDRPRKKLKAELDEVEGLMDEHLGEHCGLSDEQHARMTSLIEQFLPQP